MKKSLTEKVQTNQTITNPLADSFEIATSSGEKSETRNSLESIAKRVAGEELDVEKLAQEKKLSKLVEIKSKESDESTAKSSGLFYDLKAGIAKPHEKRRYLHHRNLSEIALRYDDHGFQEEAIGRAYDSTGKDLNTLGDTDGEDEDKPEEKKQPMNASSKFILSSSRNSPEKRKISSKHSEKTQKLKVDEKNPCWFCLSSPEVEKHLILAIGEFCYLSLAKGGLLDEHFLILPIEHIGSLNDNSNGNSEELLAELGLFKKSLKDYFGRQSKGVVFFERNFRSVHWQLQAVPVPIDLLDTLEFNIKQVSKKHFKNVNYLDIPAGCSLGDMIPKRAPYIYWQIEPLGIEFVSQIQVKGSFFPLQLGRLVLADSSILNCPDRVNWIECKKSKEEYVNLVEIIKDKYKDFDVT